MLPSLFLALAVAPAMAQDLPTDVPVEETTGPRLPVLEYRAPAVYPPGALKEGREAVVPLRLEVDAVSYTHLTLPTTPYV